MRGYCATLAAAIADFTAMRCSTFRAQRGQDLARIVVERNFRGARVLLGEAVLEFRHFAGELVLQFEGFGQFQGLWFLVDGGLKLPRSSG